MSFSCSGGECTCGRYVTGDYWILDPAPASSGTGVLVTTVLPRARDGRNGMEINPADEAVPFDSRTTGYDAAQDVALPFTANAGQSLVKAVSLEPTHADCSFGNFCGSNAICIHSYFVVTIVGTPPPADAFRPPYFSSAKPATTWRDADIDWSLVPSFNVTALPDAPTLQHVHDLVRAPAIDHWNTPGGLLQQHLAVVGTGALGTTYGSDMALGRSEALCRALGPEPVLTGSPSRADVLRAIVQQGIDTYWIVQQTGLDSDPTGVPRWMVAGGHGPGRKAGVALAATLLDDPAMRQLIADAVADELATGDHFFNEDGIVYFSTRAGRALFGERCPTHAPGTAASNALGWWNPGDLADLCRDPEELIDGGNHQQTPPPPYQYAFSSPAAGAGIFGRLLPQFRVVWAHDPFFALADRWFGYETIPGDTGAPGGLWMDDDCQDTTPAGFSPYTGCVPGAGRLCGNAPCESYHGVGGYGSWGYASAFCQAIWQAYRECANAPTSPGCTGYRGLFCGDTVCTAGETPVTCAADCP